MNLNDTTVLYGIIQIDWGKFSCIKVCWDVISWIFFICTFVYKLLETVFHKSLFWNINYWGKYVYLQNRQKLSPTEH